MHLGMCKLLREDLSIMAEQRAAAVNDREVRMALKIGHIKSEIRTLLQVANPILTY